jgi:hypothetical protein
MSAWVRGILTGVMHYLRCGNLVLVASVLVIAMLPLRAPGDRLSAFPAKLFELQVQTSVLRPVVGQNDDADENEVSTDEVEKYVSVYKAMQRDRSLTVIQAAAAQGLTLEQFRQLENRVQRDEAALQQARDELQAAAQGSPAANESR